MPCGTPLFAFGAVIARETTSCTPDVRTGEELLPAGAH